MDTIFAIFFTMGVISANGGADEPVTVSAPVAAAEQAAPARESFEARKQRIDLTNAWLRDMRRAGLTEQRYQGLTTYASNQGPRS